MQTYRPHTALPHRRAPELLRNPDHSTVAKRLVRKSVGNQLHTFLSKRRQRCPIKAMSRCHPYSRVEPMLPQHSQPCPNPCALPIHGRTGKLGPPMQRHKAPSFGVAQMLETMQPNRCPSHLQPPHPFPEIGIRRITHQPRIAIIRYNREDRLDPIPLNQLHKPPPAHAIHRRAEIVQSQKILGAHATPGSSDSESRGNSR